MKYSILLILFLFGIVSLAQNADFKKVTDADQVEKKLTEASKSITSIASDFVQEKHLEYLSVVIESKGKFWFKKPAILRWEYSEPFKYIVLINDGKITILDEDQKNEFDINSSQVFQELNEIIVNSVNGTLIASDKYDFEIFENHESWLVRMFPKNVQISNVLESMELYFLKSDLSVNKIKMVENDQDYTLITLVDKRMNVAIPESVFEVE